MSFLLDGQAVAGGLLMELLERSPIAVAILVTVIWFLKAIDKRDQRFDARWKERDDSFARQQNDWIELWKIQSEKNGAAIEKNSEVLGSVKDYLSDLKKVGGNA